MLAFLDKDGDLLADREPQFKSRVRSGSASSVFYRTRLAPHYQHATPSTLCRANECYEKRDKRLDCLSTPDV